ncbi:MAG: PIN domain-containing protein, partial [Sandaracinaceae bacterium]|nr:PIN domain-containing protein [Sandaracinaceae bacterium]
DGPVADLAAALRREHRWKLPDALQAAAARQHGLRLATRNTKDFPPAKHAFVVVPYTLRAK